MIYTVSRVGRGESEGLGDVHCIKGRERGEGESGLCTLYQGQGEGSENLGDVHCIKGRERGE